MEPASPSKQRTRTKSASNKSVEEDADTAPNQNGSKDGVSDEAATPEKAAAETVEETSVTHSKTPQARKRKHSEIKSDASSADESIPEKEVKKEPMEETSHDGETHEVVEPEKNDEGQEALQTLFQEIKQELIETGSDDISLPPKQMFGKGKRARIPNKRYSDIVLAYPKGDKPRKMENGKNVDVFEKENSLNDSVDANPAVSTLKSNRQNASSPSQPVAKKPKVTSYDLTNPNYLKPFDYGWKRELVYRATSDNSLKRNSDIYYYTPTGKKVRSFREVSEHLKNKELTLDDFTFYKEPLGVDDPEKEIIREAKLKSKDVSTPKVNKNISKVTSPKLSQSAPVTPEQTTKAKTSPKTTSSGFKVKLPNKNRKKVKLEKKPKEKDEDESAMELGTFPPNWTSPSKKTPSKWTGNKTSKPLRTTPRTSLKQKRAGAAASATAEDKNAPDTKFIKNYMQNLAYGYGALLHVFQYLKVQDLLRAGCVCTMWRDVANHPLLWKTVRMKNSQIHSFHGLAETLQKHQTVHLDLRKMLLPSTGDELWPSFSAAIKKVDSLRKIELCRCPASVIEQLAESNAKLEVINAVAIKDETLSIGNLSHVENLQELRLKATNGLTLTSDLTALKDLKCMTILSLTSIKDLCKLDLGVIADMKTLEVLELGECTDLPNTFGASILANLDKLEKLRLEKGQGTCHTFEILEAVKDMPRLERLELVNFDIKVGFDKALGVCTNIKKLLIIPTYISQSATTNNMVLGGVLRLQNTLSHFVWGVTLELLRVTELFVDQCDESEKKERKEKKLVGNGDSIPILKPVPLTGTKTEYESLTTDSPQVEILPLPNLQKLLLANLPSTRVKILKIPFHATWRQTISDTVN